MRLSDQAGATDPRVAVPLRNPRRSMAAASAKIDLATANEKLVTTVGTRIGRALYRLPILSHSQRATASGDDAPSPPAARRFASRMSEISMRPSSVSNAACNA
jgi:hypothetical protein